ncbi:hypothetical protein Tco_0581471 [Tanacetum coccineum]
MLKKFDIEDLDRLWSLVKNTFSTTDPIEDKEKELWVELKSLYEPDPRYQLWALQRYMHDPLEWRLYDTCGVHHVSTERGHKIFMLVEKDYPLTKGLTTVMLYLLVLEVWLGLILIPAPCAKKESLALDFLAFNLGPIGLEGIAKVEIAVYKVGFEESDGGMDQGEDLMTGDVEKSTGKGSDNTDEAANVLSTLEAANVLSSGSFPTAAPAGVATASGSFPTAVIFTTASVTTPYTRRTRASRGIIIEPSHTTSVPTISAKGKGKEKMVESTGTKKKKIQEQLDAQVAKELEMEFAREEQLIREQGEKDAEIARAQAEKELGMMIAELDRSNELIAKYMTEYEQAEADLSLEEKMELITELIKYQRNLAEIKKYQAQQSKPSTKTEKRNFYMAVLKSHAGWKSKDFRGMTFEQIEEKFIPVWKQLQDFVPMNFKTESERVKRPGIQLAQESSKRLKTAKASGSEPSQEHQTKDSKELSEEELKKMMEIVPVEEVYIEALQAKYPIIEWEIYSEEQRKYWKIIRVGNHTEVYQTFEEMLKRFDREDLDRLWSLVKKTFSTTDPIEDKEKELWVELKRLYEPDPRDQLWALQRYMHDPLEWRLYDTCGVHHVSTERGHEIFMLVEKDYPLTKGLTTLLLCNKLQVDQYSEMANELLIKIYGIANSPR